MRNHDHVLIVMMMIFTYWSDQGFPIFSPGAFSLLLLQNILLQIDILQIAWFHADRKDDNEENQSNNDGYYYYYGHD